MNAMHMLGRWVLGGWLSAVGCSYWVNFPFIHTQHELALELSAAFIDTGLAACASALLIGAGLCLLANRLTILALLAGLSVFTAAAYWAVLTLELAPILMTGATLILITLLLLGYWPNLAYLFSPLAAGRVESGKDKNSTLRRATVFSHYLWGGWWIISGLFHFVTGPIIGSSPLAVQLIMALLHSRMYELIKAIEAIGGLAILSRRWAPLLLAVNIPITFVVMYWDAILQDPGNPIGIFIAILTFATTALLVRNYGDYLRPLIAWAPHPAAGQSPAPRPEWA